MNNTVDFNPSPKFVAKNRSPSQGLVSEGGPSAATAQRLAQLEYTTHEVRHTSNPVLNMRVYSVSKELERLYGELVETNRRAT